MLEVKKTNNGLILSLSFKLDKDDAKDLIKDLQEYVKPKVTFQNKAHQESFEQAQSKLALEKEMKRVFVDVFDDEYLATKFATVYKLDELNREIEITRKKLNELKNK